MRKDTLISILLTLAGISLAMGILGSVWTLDWRYMVTGVVGALLLSIPAGALIEQEKKK